MSLLTPQEQLAVQVLETCDRIERWLRTGHHFETTEEALEAVQDRMLYARKLANLIIEPDPQELK